MLTLFIRNSLITLASLLISTSLIANTPIDLNGQNVQNNTLAATEFMLPTQTLTAISLADPIHLKTQNTNTMIKPTLSSLTQSVTPSASSSLETNQIAGLLFVIFWSLLGIISAVIPDNETQSSHSIKQPS